MATAMVAAVGGHAWDHVEQEKLIKEGQSRNKSKKSLLLGAGHYIGVLEAGRQGKTSRRGVSFLIYFIPSSRCRTCATSQASPGGEVHVGRCLLCGYEEEEARNVRVGPVPVTTAFA